MFCKYCGKELKDDAKFCPYCGKEQTPDISEKETDVKKDSSTAANKSDIVKTDKVKKTSESKNSKKRSPLKRGLIVAACVLVVAVIVAGVVIARNGLNGSTGLTASSNSTESVDLSGKSSGYKDAYKFASENALKIVQRDIQDTVLHSISPNEYNEYFEQYKDATSGTVNSMIVYDNDTFESYVDDFDPQLFATYMDQENNYSFPSYYMDDRGIATYLKKYDVVNEFADSDECVYTVCLTNCFDYNILNENSKDFISDNYITLCTYEDFALLSSINTVGDIMTLMSYLSGYQVISETINKMLTDIDTYTGTYSDENADAIEGRKAALVEYFNKWEDARIQWETEFLEDCGLDGYISTIEDNHKGYTDENGNNTVVDTNETEEDSSESEDDSYETETDFYESEDESSDEDDADSNDKYIATLGSHIWQLANKDGNQYYFFPYDSFSRMVVDVGSDGKWQAFYSAAAWGGTHISDLRASYDIDGNSLCEPGQTFFYYGNEASHKFATGDVTGISPSGNQLTCTEESDLANGTYQILQLLRTDGSTQDLVKMQKGHTTAEPISDIEFYGYNTKYYPVYPDDFVYSDKWQVHYEPLKDVEDIESWDFVIDLATGESSDIELEDTGVDVYITDPFTIEEHDEVQEGTVPDSYMEISPDYYVDTKTWDVFAKDNLDTRVKTLANGQGIAKMIYNMEQDIYWVITETGYYYKMDSDFNEVTEFFKIPDGSFADVCPYGIIINDDYGGYLYNEQGAASISSNTDLSCSAFVAANSEGTYNLDSLELIRVSKPSDNQVIDQPENQADDQSDNQKGD